MIGEYRQRRQDECLVERGGRRKEKIEEEFPKRGNRRCRETEVRDGLENSPERKLVHSGEWGVRGQ